MFFKKIIKEQDKSFFKDSFWALLGSVLGKGLSLLAGVAVARFLGKDMYGEYGMIKNTMFQIATFSTFGLGYTGTRFIAKSIQNRDGQIHDIIKIIYKITFSISCFLSITIILFSKQIALFLNNPGASTSIKFTAIIIIINAVNTAQIGILSGFKSFKVIAQNNTWSGIVTFILSIICTMMGGLNGALIALLFSLTFNALLNNKSIKKILKNHTREEHYPLMRGNIASTIIRFSFPVALQESLYSIVAWSISLLIIKFSNYGELGLYSAATQWANIILFIPGVLKNVILSYFSSSNNNINLRNKVLKINVFSTLIPFCFIFILSSYISSFYGTTFQNLPPVLIVACFTSIFSSISSVIIYEFISQGFVWNVFYLRIFRDFASLSLSALILKFNYFELTASMTIVIVYLLVGILFSVILLRYSKKKLG